MSNYPDEIDSFRTLENIPGQTYDPTKLTTIFAEDLNNKGESIVAIEEALGVGFQNIFDFFYPVGKIIEFGDSTATPESRGMLGTWVRHCEGKGHVSLDSGDADFDTVGETGGAKTIDLEHQHDQGMGSDTNAAYFRRDGSGNPPYGSNTGSGSRGQIPYTSTGSAGWRTALTDNQLSSAQNIMNPYSVTVCWIRTA